MSNVSSLTNHWQIKAKRILSLFCARTFYSHVSVHSVHVRFHWISLFVTAILYSNIKRMFSHCLPWTFLLSLRSEHGETSTMSHTPSVFSCAGFDKRKSYWKKNWSISFRFFLSSCVLHYFKLISNIFILISEKC